MNGKTTKGSARRFGLCVALLAGCGPTLGARQQLINMARATIVANEPLRRLDQPDVDALACRNQGEVSQLAANAFQVRICGMILEYTRDGRGRYEFFPMRPAAALATGDLDCPIESLQPITELSTVSRRVINGCGRRATYELECSDHLGCAWRQTAIAALAAPPPPNPTVVLDRMVVPRDPPPPTQGEPPREGNPSQPPTLQAPGGP